MGKASVQRPQGERGFTLMEVLIAVLLTAIITAAAYQFYASTHQQVVSQMEISDMQQICRNTLNEIGRTVRMAGFKIGTHPPYRINGDSLYVFFCGSQPVDTVLYYLQEYADFDYGALGPLPAGTHLHRLMKKVNSGPAAVFSDLISRIRFVPVDSTSLAITVAVHAAKADPTFNQNQGYRTFVNTERAEMRNLTLN